MVNKQRGFTLVEIAIVLVIIGLLLGGILKGQELITAARVRSVADLATGIQTAYYGFLDRYRAVPGDMPGVQACAAIGGNACTVGGDGDGQIEAPFSEPAAAWSHMAAAGFLQGNYLGTAITEAAYVSATTPAAPTNPWKGFLLLARTAEYRPTATGQAARLHLILGRSVPVDVMREIDVKVDDSLPDSGILRSAPLSDASTSFGRVGGSDATTGTPCVTVSAGTPSVWNITGGSADCNGYFLY